LNYPYKLHTMLTSITQFIQSSYTRPAQSMSTSFDMLSNDVDHQLNRIKPVYQKQIPEFNDMVRTMKIPTPVYIQ